MVVMQTTQSVISTFYGVRFDVVSDDNLEFCLEAVERKWRN